MTEYTTDNANPLDPDAEPDSLAFMDYPLPEYEGGRSMFTDEKLERIGI